MSIPFTSTFLSHRLYNAASSMIKVTKEDSPLAVRQAISMFKALH